MSERRACVVLGQHRSTQRKLPRGRADEDVLTRTIIGLASRFGRYGYRRIHWLLEQDGWSVSLKRVKRIWRREGLKVPQKQPKRGRLWLNDGSCIRLRPTHRNHVWSYDFVMDRTHDGKAFRMLNIVDEFTRESFNGKLRDECLNREIFFSLREAQIVIEEWRIFYNTERPHSSLGYRPPAPKTILPSTIPTAYAPERATQAQAQAHAGF